VLISEICGFIFCLQSIRSLGGDYLVNFILLFFSKEKRRCYILQIQIFYSSAAVFGHHVHRHGVDTFEQRAMNIEA